MFIYNPPPGEIPRPRQVIERMEDRREESVRELYLQVIESLNTAKEFPVQVYISRFSKEAIVRVMIDLEQLGYVVKFNKDDPAIMEISI